MVKELRHLHPRPSRLRVVAKSGGRLKELSDIAANLVLNSDTPSCHVYFLAGLCDVTYRDYDPYYSPYEHYDEVIFNESPDSAVARISEELERAADTVIEYGATPCFTTIVPCSLRVWNENRLHQGKTSFLLHHRQYEDMQANLISTITSINRHIIKINTDNNMITPFIAETIVSNTGPTKPPRVHYNRLQDGTHPTIKLRSKWCNLLCKSVISNRTNYY